MITKDLLHKIIKDVLAEQEPQGDELQFSKSLLDQLETDVELNKIIAEIIDNAEEFDPINEVVLDNMLCEMDGKLIEYKDDFLFILKSLITKALDKSDYYPYLLSIIFNNINDSSLVELDSKIVAELTPDLVRLMESKNAENNFFALKMVQSFSKNTAFSSSQFEAVAINKFNEKPEWELRQQIFAVLKSIGTETGNISRSLVDKISWPYFFMYKRNKAWL
ncbi:MAG: hypothetical protein MI810_18100 [Flavobacteriales bacterium]|nr:hypothetical protein [Flavobacteriales bacterium]